MLNLIFNNHAVSPFVPSKNGLVLNDDYSIVKREWMLWIFIEVQTLKGSIKISTLEMARTISIRNIVHYAGCNIISLMIHAMSWICDANRILYI